MASTSDTLGETENGTTSALYSTMADDVITDSKTSSSSSSELASTSLDYLVPGSVSYPGLFSVAPADGDESIDDLTHPYWKQWNLEEMIPDSWHYAVAAWMTFFGIFGTLGNLLVIYTFIRVKSLRTASNIMMVNLALSDMSFSAINGFPLLTISAINKRWAWGRTCCRIYGFCGGLLGFVSIYSLMWIAIDRYQVITQPLKAARIMTKKRSFAIVGGVWTWCLAVSLPPFIGWGDYIPEAFQTSCTFDYLTQSIQNITFNIGIYVGGFVIPVMVIFVSYMGIIRGVLAHHREMRATAERMGAKTDKMENERRAEIQISKTSAITIGSYLFSWTPYACVGLMGLIYPPEDMMIHPLLSEIAVMFAKASAAYNPLIYAISHPRFQVEIRRMFPWLFCCSPAAPKRTLTASATRDTIRSTMSRGSDSENTDVMSMTVVNTESDRAQNGVSHAPSGANTRRANEAEHPVNPSASQDL